MPSYHIDMQKVIIDDVIGHKGVNEEAIPGIHDYGGRHAVTGKPGDILVIRDGEGASDVEEYVANYLNTIDIGVSHTVTVPPSESHPYDKTVVEHCLNTPESITAIAKMIEEQHSGTTGFLTFNYSDQAAQLAEALHTSADQEIQYLGATSEQSHYYNDKARFKDFVAELGIPTIPDIRIPDEKVSQSTLRNAYLQMAQDDKVIVKANKGASGIGMFVVQEDTIDTVVTEMSNASDDVTRWLVEPYYETIESTSLLYRTLHGKPEQISRVSRQLFVEDDEDTTKHHGNIYPAGVDDHVDTIRDIVMRIARAQAESGANIHTGGIDFVIPTGSEQVTVLPSENNFRLTGHDPLAALHDTLCRRHDCEDLYMISYNLHVHKGTDFNDFKEALASQNVLYRGNTTKGTIPTNVGPLHAGKATVVSFGSTPEDVQEVVETTTRAADDSDSRLFIKHQTPWWPE